QQQQLENAVERLSKFIEGPFNEHDQNYVMEIRMQVINLSVLNDTLCKKMYDCIENELLGSLELTTHHIAPYNSIGVLRASELVDYREFDPSSSSTKISLDADVPLETCLVSTRIGTEVMSKRSHNDQDHVLVVNCPFSSRKRSREDNAGKRNTGGISFDLNMPAEGIDMKDAVLEAHND
ncbi:hypothetical protein KI387_014298, partial [Taxus chinensis]